ncbi:MAG: type II toxin-antitoxin system MazE family antitoxin [Waterburya sp.]
MSKISINLDDSLLEFLDQVTDNRSKYINELIQQQNRKAFEAKLEEDYRQQSNDEEWQAEVKLWDSTTSDGLDDSVEGMVNYE